MNPLAKRIVETNVVPGALSIWWIGQAGFVVKSPRLTVYIDPYLSDFCEQLTRGRPDEHVLITPPPLAPADVDHTDYVLCTHGHADHLDPDGIPVIARRSPRARFVVPRCALATMLRLGINRERILTLVGDDRLELPELEIEALPAMHERFDRDPENGYPYLSYLMTIEGINIFHAGDTIPYDGQVERAAARPIDVALAPINGRDAFRRELGFEGNFTAAEAVEFAIGARAGLTIPMHYDKFTINTADVGEFERLAKSRGLRHHIMHVGDSITYPRHIK